MAERQFVTLMIAGQLCGIDVRSVRDVLGEQATARIPLAPPEIAGSLNLRGRIVTAIDLRCRLGLPPGPPGVPRMSLVVEQRNELYALLVDQVAEVTSFAASAFEAVPPTLSAAWAAVSGGIYRLDRGLLLVLNIDRLLAVGEAR